MKDYWFYWFACTAGLALYFASNVPIREMLVPAVIIGFGFVIKNIESSKKK